MSTFTQTNERNAGTDACANSGASSGVQRETFVTPVTNIVETEEGYFLEAEMPGVSREGLEVTVDDGELVLVGRRADKTAPGTAVYRESRTHSFRRVFDLDPSIDTTRISAKLEQGVLRVTLPKAEAVKPWKIEVTD